MLAGLVRTALLRGRIDQLVATSHEDGKACHGTEWGSCAAVQGDTLDNLLSKLVRL